MNKKVRVIDRFGWGKSENLINMQDQIEMFTELMTRHKKGELIFYTGLVYEDPKIRILKLVKDLKARSEKIANDWIGKLIINARKEEKK